MTDAETEIAARLRFARAGCWCEPYPNPCHYHEGMRDGADLALEVTDAHLDESEEDR